MTKKEIWTFIKFFGCGVIVSFIAIVMTFFILAYTVFMDITLMLLLGIVWVLIGVLPSLLTAIWLILSQSKTPNYTQLFIVQFIVAISLVLGFIILTGELRGGLSKELLLTFSLVIIGMGVVSGVVGLVSGFFTFKTKT